MREDDGTSPHDSIGGLDDATPFFFQARMHNGNVGSGVTGISSCSLMRWRLLLTSLGVFCIRIMRYGCGVGIKYVSLLLRPFSKLASTNVDPAIYSGAPITKIGRQCNPSLPFSEPSTLPVRRLRRGMSAWHYEMLHSTEYLN